MRHIVLYDGECGLCQHSVQWLLDHDRTGMLFYAPLQGETAAELLASVQLPDGLDSIIYVSESEGSMSVEWYSTGILQLLRLLPLPWSLGRFFLWVPKFIRDGVYRFIARNRIKWFGNADSCRLPSVDEVSRFLP